MRKLLHILVLFLMVGCSSVKYIPVQGNKVIEYRDTTVYVKDTVTIEVPREKIVEVIPDIDTSYLSTDVAKSTAYLDKSRKKLHHTIEQCGTIKTKIDTVIEIQYINSYVDKEIPVEVEVVKYKRDNLFWFSIIFNILTVLIIILKIYLKFKL